LDDVKKHESRITSPEMRYFGKRMEKTRRGRIGNSQIRRILNQSQLPKSSTGGNQDILGT
jgi:hypothetical protein